MASSSWWKQPGPASSLPLPQPPFFCSFFSLLSPSEFSSLQASTLSPPLFFSLLPPVGVWLEVPTLHTCSLSWLPVKARRVERNRATHLPLHSVPCLPASLWLHLALYRGRGWRPAHHWASEVVGQGAHPCQQILPVAALVS